MARKLPDPKPKPAKGGLEAKLNPELRNHQVLRLRRISERRNIILERLRNMRASSTTLSSLLREQADKGQSHLLIAGDRLVLTKPVHNSFPIKDLLDELAKEK